VTLRWKKSPSISAPALNCPLKSEINFLSFVSIAPYLFHSRYRMITNNTGEIKRELFNNAGK